MTNVLTFKRKESAQQENKELMTEFNEFELTDEERSRLEKRMKEANSKSSIYDKFKNKISGHHHDPEKMKNLNFITEPVQQEFVNHNSKEKEQTKKLSLIHGGKLERKLSLIHGGKE